MSRKNRARGLFRQPADPHPHQPHFSGELDPLETGEGRSAYILPGVGVIGSVSAWVKVVKSANRIFIATVLRAVTRIISGRPPA